MRTISIVALALTIGCSASQPNKLARKQSILFVPQPINRGCAWTIQENFDPLTEWFEVWSQDLSQPFTLRTTTTTNRATFPEVQQEFYKVRTANIYGEFSDWATTEQ